MNVTWKIKGSMAEYQQKRGGGEQEVRQLLQLVVPQQPNLEC